MGGHGGLNILPQKRWNVYNFDNREKVKQDEEAAAKEEQQKREQSRKRDHEFRLEQLRQARGLASSSKSGQLHKSGSELEPELKVDVRGETRDKKTEGLPESKLGVTELKVEPKSKHINLFEGIRIFDPVGIEGEGDEKRKGFKRMKKEVAAPAPKVVLPEDEKYRLGYGVAGKGVKLPWYMEKQKGDAKENGGDSDEEKAVVRNSSGKKTLEELREERLNREKREKERERALLGKGRKDVGVMPDRYHRRGDRHY